MRGSTALAVTMMLLRAGDAGAGTGITDKTMIAWVTPADLTQCGGSVLTIEKPGGVFDAMVFGEIAAGKWMAGSEHFKRTQREQSAFPAETAGAGALVQVAIVYRGRRITVYRDGKVYADYTATGSERFGAGSFVLMGLRHVDAVPGNRFFAGAIDDARIYDAAMDKETVASLKPNEPSDPRPLAWWDFEDGSAADRMKAFPASTLFGGARIAGGRLHLDGKGAYMMASNAAPEAGGATIDLGSASDAARALREQLLADPHRPGYHFVVPEGKCMPFDPNGAIFWKGRYHLFYIFQDGRGHSWGHVSSTDLFHWRFHPTGLVSGMFSGNCFVNRDGRPTMCFHDQVRGGNTMAVALDDELNEWKRLELITPGTAPGDPHHGKYRSWDPYGWLEGDTYYAIFGGERPAVAKSHDLPPSMLSEKVRTNVREGEWEYVGDLMASALEGVSINEDVSCADLFKIGDRHMLLCISHRLGCRYYLGRWENEQFHPEFHERMSWADNSFFAPESLLDDRGRRIMWAWIFDGPGFATRTDHGWSGTMSLPRVLSLAADGTLRMDVPEEIEALRHNGRSMRDLTIEADSELALEDVSGKSIELVIEMDAPGASRFGVKVRRSPGGEEETLVFYDADEKKLSVDTRRSSLTDGPKGVEAGPFELGGNELLELRVFVDRSVVEVFANGRQAVMRRVYPSRKDSVGVALFSAGGPARVRTLKAWEMMPSNPY